MAGGANRVGGKLRKSVIAELVEGLHGDGYVIGGIRSSIDGQVGIPVLRRRRVSAPLFSCSQLPLTVAAGSQEHPRNS